MLARGGRPVPEGRWTVRVTAICTDLRDAMLAYRDGAELVATVSAFGLGARAPYDALAGALSACGLDDRLAAWPPDPAALRARPRRRRADPPPGGQRGCDPDEPREESDFAVGLAIVVDGVRSRQGSTTAP